MLVLILLVSVLFPIAWLLSEAQSRGWIRILLGVSSIFVCSFVSYSFGSFSLVFQKNTEFTGASRKLIDAIIVELEAGNADKLSSDLKALQLSVYENYENYPRYTDIVDKFVAKIEVTKDYGK